MILIEPELI